MALIKAHYIIPLIMPRFFPNDHSIFTEDAQSLYTIQCSIYDDTSQCYFTKTDNITHDMYQNMTSRDKVKIVGTLLKFSILLLKVSYG